MAQELIGVFLFSDWLKPREALGARLRYFDRAVQNGGTFHAFGTPIPSRSIRQMLTIFS